MGIWEAMEVWGNGCYEDYLIPSGEVRALNLALIDLDRSFQDHDVVPGFRQLASLSPNAIVPCVNIRKPGLASEPSIVEPGVINIAVHLSNNKASQF